MKLYVLAIFVEFLYLKTALSVYTVIACMQVSHRRATFIKKF